jgi:hypothetical protein
MAMLPPVIATVTQIAPTTSSSEHRDTRGSRGRENRSSTSDIGKSAMTVNHTIENLRHSDIRDTAGIWHAHLGCYNQVCARARIYQ